MNDYITWNTSYMTVTLCYMDGKMIAVPYLLLVLNIGQFSTIV